MFKKTLLPLFLALTATTSQAASFDCAKASTNTEKLICGDETLSALDSQLASVYKQALETSVDKDAFKQAQRDWIKSRNQCADVACLNAEYKKRLGFIQSNPAPTSANTDTNSAVTTPAPTQVAESLTDAKGAFKGEPAMQPLIIDKGKQNEVCKVFLDYLKTTYRKGDCGLREYPKDRQLKSPELTPIDVRQFEDQEVAYLSHSESTYDRDIGSKRIKIFNSRNLRMAFLLDFDVLSLGKKEKMIFITSRSTSDDCEELSGTTYYFGDQRILFDKTKVPMDYGIPFTYKGHSFFGGKAWVGDFILDPSSKSDRFPMGEMTVRNICYFYDTSL